MSRRLAVALAPLVLLLLAGCSDDPEPQGAPCEGHVALCDRPYDEVAFAATHNSMSAASERGWFFAEQPDGIVAQLDHGIRVLLIDSWYGQDTDRRGIVATAEKQRQQAFDQAKEEFGERPVRAVLRARGALGLAPHGDARPYLCHAMCELGSTSWLQSLRDIRAWLEDHPREVVTLFVQDEVTPADTARVIEDAGLDRYVYTPAADGSWPTLGEMIDAGTRLVVLMENHGGGDRLPWLIQGFDVVQDTPFLFASPDDFTCEPNRGDPDAPLFLVNHWIDQKRNVPQNAALVNARDVLLPRLRECEEERGQLPSFVAVDYYDRGDLLDVVDELNGVG
ncbi:hypothetical protein [Nocardioides mangrovi]|uniref:Uncharacterized protein n=1 Tax=Nocardioides mangrovi TaxID=2874580 RepID=A0ABS7UIV8_9ACTN|nr:hypothetical protein [Nocardioides mangrovi]MBZ5740720.1 hypothetical protein [Nocardioides mangrovi]